MAHPLTPSFLLLALLLEQHHKLCVTTSFAGYVGPGRAEGFNLILGWQQCRLWGCPLWTLVGKAVCSSPGNQDRRLCLDEAALPVAAWLGPGSAPSFVLAARRSAVQHGHLAATAAAVLVQGGCLL